MKKLKTSIAMLILAVLSITGVLAPITAYAADSYKVQKINYDGYVNALNIINESTGETVVGYCYNASKGWPGWGRQTVYKYENATNEQFVKLAGNQVRNQSSLREDVLKVCYKGFPRDGKGLKDKYHLDKATFRLITQLAVWYYTDSATFRSQQISTTYDWMLTSDAEQAYNELINTPVTLPANYTLDLYENKSSYDQNILSTKLAENYVPPKEYSIEFSKKADNLGGAELNGATLQVLNTDGSLIEGWKTDGVNTHRIDLIAGEYIFREITEPNGYVKVSDIRFKVEDNGNVSIISKADTDTAEGGSSKLTVVDKKIPIVYKPLTVKKVWELYGHQDSEIPDSVQVQLYENGVESGTPVTLKKSEGWTYTWPQLDSSKTYTVDEVNTPDNCEKRIEAGADGNFTIYNSMKPELTIEKIVRDGEWADKTREFDFRIELKDENNQPINSNFACVKENKDGSQETGSLEVKDGWGTFKLGHEQKIKIKGLPPKVTYHVEEVSDGNTAFVASYKINNQKAEKTCPPVQITNENLNNVVTVYNTFNEIVPTGIDSNNKYIVPGALLLIAGILLFGGIAVLRSRKRLK